MINNTTKSEFGREYEERFAWREARYIANLEELSSIAQTGGSDAIRVLPNLVSYRVGDNPKDALKWSILTLWLEATECFIFGLYESCILTCGAIVERCLKLEYQEAKGALPRGQWTLGKCIHKLDWTGIIELEVLNLAKQILDPRNSRSHALLEHDDPQLALLGGSERGIEIRGPYHYLVEPFRGDATKTIEITFKILSRLYSAQPS